MTTDHDAPLIGEEFVIQARRQIEASVTLIQHCLYQLDDDQIWSRPREDVNSIANLLLHLAGNLRQRFRSDIGGEAGDRDRLGEFTDRRAVPKAELERLLKQSADLADEVLTKITSHQLIEMQKVERLDGVEEQSVLGIVFQTVAHLNGHAQEILHMTRMQLGGRYVFHHPDGVPPEMRGASVEF